MKLGLKDKNVLVMASAAGLGKAIAKELAYEGANVVICTSKEYEDELDSAVQEIFRETNNKPYKYICNINNPEDIKKLVSNVNNDLGDIYALANMCPGPKPGQFEDFSDAEWQSAFETCLLSYVRTIRAVLPSMKRIGAGRIINSTSSSVKDTLENLILSNSMRMGVVGMSKTLSKEFGKYNILINVIGPGRISTDRITNLNKVRAEKQNISVEEYEKNDLKSFPLGRYGNPEEYAKLATFLLSESNSYISGQTILVDGAMTSAY